MTCHYCNNPFTPRQITQKYCSKICCCKHWHATNKTYSKQLAKEWNDNNKELRKTYCAKWRNDNKSWTENWRKNNSDKRCTLEARYRAAKLNASPKWLSEKDKKVIDLYYATAKWIQSILLTPIDVDHIVPLQGRNVCGLHVPWNLQLLHKRDNIVKGNRS